MTTTHSDARRVHTAEPVPQWDLSDRLNKSLRFAGIGVGEIATELGKSRNAVSAWVNGRAMPSQLTLRVWALKTGVTYEWLTEGTANIPAEYTSERQARILLEALNPPRRRHRRRSESVGNPSIRWSMVTAGQRHGGMAP